MFGQFTGQNKSDSTLDLARADGGLLAVLCQARGFGGDALKHVVDERVHDSHGFAGHSSVGVNLFQHFVDEPCISFFSLHLGFSLVTRSTGCRLCHFNGFLRALLSSTSRHSVSDIFLNLLAFDYFSFSNLEQLEIYAENLRSPEFIAEVLTYQISLRSKFFRFDWLFCN